MEYQGILSQVENLLSEHYDDEKEFLAKLAKDQPELAAKMRSQHDEVFEISGHLTIAFACAQAGDALRLVYRFHALAQHNIIEEERDVFPVAARCFQF